VPNGDGNRSRWPLHPLWRDLLARIADLPHLGVCRIDGKALALEERMVCYAQSVYGYLKAVAAVYAIQKQEEGVAAEQALAHLRERMWAIHDPLSWGIDVEKRRAEIERGAW
jgi:hypothetical protein